MPVSAPHRPEAPGSSPRLPLPATASSDAALVARAARGDERAFELLFQRHRADVLAYATRMLRDHGRAEDVVQDVFVSAMRAILRAEPEDLPVHVRAWLREIARRACIDQWRGASRRGEVSLDDPERMLAGDALRLADVDSLTRATDDRESVATLRRAFDDLPELQHAVLVQRELEGRSIAEIADRLGLTPTVVEGQLARGRRALGQAYRELESGERCVAVRALCDTSLHGGHLGVRDRHRVGRHVHGCDGCRRYARSSGVDARLIDRTVLSRASLLLPLPLLRRLPMEPAIAGEAVGGALGAKVLVSAAVVAAGGGSVYVTHSQPLSSSAPSSAATAAAPAASPFGLGAGPDGRPVLRVGPDGSLGPVVLPAGGTGPAARAAQPFAPPWATADEHPAGSVDGVGPPASAAEAPDGAEPSDDAAPASPADRPTAPDGIATPPRGTAPGSPAPDADDPPVGETPSTPPGDDAPRDPAPSGEPAPSDDASPSAGPAPSLDPTPSDDVAAAPPAPEPAPDDPAAPADVPASVDLPMMIVGPAGDQQVSVDDPPAADPAPSGAAPDVAAEPAPGVPDQTAVAPSDPAPAPAAPDGGAPVGH